MSNETYNYAKSFAELWTVVLRYKWRFIVPAFLVMIGVLAGTMVLPRKYKAEALFERKTDLVLTEINRKGGSRAFNNTRQTVIQELTGETAINELIEGLTPRLTKDLALHSKQSIDIRKLRRDLHHNLMVRYDLASSEVDRIRLQFVNNNPKLAKYVVNQLVKNYITRVHQSLDEKLMQTSAFFKKEVDLCRKNIEELESKKLNFEIKYAELLPDSPTNTQSQLTELELELTETQQLLDIAVMRSDSLRQSLKDTNENTPSYTSERNPKLTALEKKLSDLQDRKKEYVAVLKMTAKHPDLINLDDQIARLEQQILETEETVITHTQISANPKHAEIELMMNNTIAEKNALENQVNLLSKKIASIKSQTGNIFLVRSNYRTINRDIEKQQRQLTFWEDNLRRIDVSLAAKTGDRGVQLTMLAPATRIGAPISPNPKQGIAAAIILGFIVGGTSVFFGHRTNESFSNGEQLTEEFDLPVMGAVSEIITKQQKRIRQVRKMVLYPVNAVAMIVILAFMTNLLFASLHDVDHKIDSIDNNSEMRSDNNNAVKMTQE